MSGGQEVTPQPEAPDDPIVIQPVATAGVSDSGTVATNPDAPVTTNVVADTPSGIDTASFMMPMPKPIMGDFLHHEKEYIIVWVGGKPLIKWTGLDPNTITIPTPMMQRSTKDVKSYAYRTKGLETKFGPKDDLRAFCRNVFNHMKEHGMDTISYIPDPSRTNTMESIVEKPNLFTKEYVVTQIPKYAPLYDEYDRLNIRSATRFVLSSLNPELERKVNEALVTTPNPSFLLVWMTLIEKIRILSVGRLNILQKRIETRMPTDYPGQNLDAMAEANLRDLLDLQQGGWYGTATGYQMVRNFSTANSECPEYKQFAFDILTRYKSAIQKCFHMGPKESNAYMEDKGFGFEEICILFGDYYRTAHQDGHWLPTKNVRDTRGAPTNFANKAQSRRALNVVQNSPSTGTCHSCGLPGHWAKNCPTKNKQPLRAPTNNAQSTSWTRTPPSSGSPVTKTMHGKTFHWCAKCKRWTTSHGTDQHKSKSETGIATTPSKEVQLATTSLYTAWNCTIPTNEHDKPNVTKSIVSMGMGLIWSEVMYPILISISITFSIFAFICMMPMLLAVLDLLGCLVRFPLHLLYHFSVGRNAN
jgi:Zinc knuckle